MALRSWHDKLLEPLRAAKGGPRSRFLNVVAQYLVRRDPDLSIVTRQQLAAVEKIVAGQIQKNAELQQELDSLDDHLHILTRRLRKADLKLQALVRHDFRDRFGPPRPDMELDDRRFSLVSQNEEDGYVLALLDRCRPLGRTFVEFGSGRSGGNSGVLALEARWRGLMVEADPQDARVARERFAGDGRVAVINTFVTAANADSLIAEQGLGPDVDLLSLDIDSFEYWVLAGLTRCRPKLLVVEYNDRFGPERRVTVPADPREPPNLKLGYHGASLAALTSLAVGKGYRLVCCDRSGTNAFFLRDGLATELPARTAAQAFRAKRGRSLSEIGEPFVQHLRERKLDLAEV
jgi:hypothetical protein